MPNAGLKPSRTQVRLRFQGEFRSACISALRNRRTRADRKQAGRIVDSRNPAEMFRSFRSSTLEGVVRLSLASEHARPS